MYDILKQWVRAISCFAYVIGSTNYKDTPCKGGWYCRGGAKSATPKAEDGNGGPCPRGHFCVAGEENPVKCPEGKYTNRTQQSSCEVCPGGFACEEGSVDPVPCPSGYYCPAGTGTNTQPCPSGTYYNGTGISREADCTPCDGGMYCLSAGLVTPTGKCSANYY